MNNTGRHNIEESGIERLLSNYLAARSSLKSSVGETSFHLDEDSLAAFAEGNLSERESAPMVRHLVDCGYCLHKTAELVRLDLELAAFDEVTVSTEAAEPASISQVLSGVLAKLFGSADQAVFAHNEEEKEKEAKEESSKED